MDMSTIVNRYREIGLITLMFLSFILAKPANAIIVGVPVVAISILKLTALVVSALAVPLTAVINIIKKDTKKTVLITLTVLSVIFVIVYAALSYLKVNPLPLTLEGWGINLK